MAQISFTKTHKMLLSPMPTSRLLWNFLILNIVGASFFTRELPPCQDKTPSCVHTDAELLHMACEESPTIRALCQHSCIAIAATTATTCKYEPSDKQVGAVAKAADDCPACSCNLACPTPPAIQLTCPEPECTCNCPDPVIQVGECAADGSFDSGTSSWSSSTSGSSSSSSSETSTTTDSQTTTTETTTTTTTSQSPDCALGKPVIVSTQESSHFQAAWAVDGDDGTRWSSSFLDNQWIVVDLEQPTAMGTLRILWEGAFASKYNVEISDSVDANGHSDTWTMIAEDVTGTVGHVDTVVNQTARYLRVFATRRATPFGVSIWSLEISGCGGTQTSTSTSTESETTDTTTTSEGSSTTTTNYTSTGSGTETTTTQTGGSKAEGSFDMSVTRPAIAADRSA